MTSPSEPPALGASRATTGSAPARPISHAFLGHGRADRNYPEIRGELLTIRAQVIVRMPRATDANRFPVLPDQ